MLLFMKNVFIVKWK